MTLRGLHVSRWIRSKARRCLGSLTKVITDAPVVALTFDDGPDPEVTPRLLRLLDNNNARATFFMVGETAQRYPELVRYMAEKGHALGSHSWDHSAFPLLSGSQRRDQLRACECLVQPDGFRLFRPPYGEQTLASRLDAWWLGYEVVGWSVTSEDWYEPHAAVMADTLLKRIGPGDIVLLHDAIFDKGFPRRGPMPDRSVCINRQAMLTALECVFQNLTARFRFVTVPELFQYGSPYYSYWFKQTARPNGLGRVETLLQQLG